MSRNSGQRRSGGSSVANSGGVVLVVGGHETQELAGNVKTLILAWGGEMGDAALRRVGSRAAKLLMGDDLARDGADDVRAGDVHLADAPLP